MSKSDSIDILREVAKERKVSPQMLTMLEHIIGAESGGERFAANKKSSARGVFQFLDGTWLGMIKTHKNDPVFKELGLDKYADAIHQVRDKGGKLVWTIDDPELKKEVLDLRYNVKISCEMGIAFARDNETTLKKSLNRELTAGEFYLAHFLGPANAKRVLTHGDPATPISSILLDSADVMASNKGVHLNRGGKRTDFANFTVADIQQWAAHKMEQPFNYEAMTEAQRKVSWRQKHLHPDPKKRKFGEEDDYSDIVEARGEMTQTELILDLIVGLLEGLFSGFAVSNATPNGSAPKTPPVPKVVETRPQREAAQHA